MIPRNRERVTLIVEQEAVRLLAVAGGKVIRWGSAPLPRGTLDSDGVVVHPAALTLVLERLWETQGATKGHVLLALPGHHVASTVTPLAGMDSASRSLLNEAARVALPAPNTYLAWQQVGPTTRPSLFVVA